MTYAEFRTLVAEMRLAQREYFRTRDSEILRESKALERKVDKAIVEADNPQPNLFD